MFSYNTWKVKSSDVDVFPWLSVVTICQKNVVLELTETLLNVVVSTTPNEANKSVAFVPKNTS